MPFSLIIGITTRDEHDDAQSSQPRGTSPGVHGESQRDRVGRAHWRGAGYAVAYSQRTKCGERGPQHPPGGGAVALSRFLRQGAAPVRPLAPVAEETPQHQTACRGPRFQISLEQSISHTATVTVVSVRVTARYSVSRSNGTRPASVIRRIKSCRESA